MASLRAYATFLTFMCILQLTGLSETSTGKTSTGIPECPEDHRSMPHNLTCELKSETIHDRNATRQIDIHMGLSQLMFVLNNSVHLHTDNGGLTIANGEDIVDNTHAEEFRKRWYIAITAEVDSRLRQGLFLRYTLSVRDVTHADEYHFRLVFKTDTLSFSTNDSIWFPIPTDPVKSTTDPVTPPAYSSTNTPPTGCEALSQQEFQEAINYQNDMIDKNLTNLKEECSRGTCTCTGRSWGFFEITTVIILLVLFVLAVLILHSIRSSPNRYPLVGQKGPGAGLNKETVSNQPQPQPGSGTELQQSSSSSSLLQYTV